MYCFLIADWMVRAIFMKALAAVCVVGMVIALVVLVTCYRQDWHKARGVMTALIPLSVIAGM